MTCAGAGAGADDADAQHRRQRRVLQRREGLALSPDDAVVAILHIA